MEQVMPNLAFVANRFPAMDATMSTRDGIHCPTTDAQPLGDPALRQLACLQQAIDFLNKRRR
jgi:hypothetical protein